MSSCQSRLGLCQVAGPKHCRSSCVRAGRVTRLGGRGFWGALLHDLVCQNRKKPGRGSASLCDSSKPNAEGAGGESNPVSRSFAAAPLGFPGEVPRAPGPGSKFSPDKNDGHKSLGALQRGHDSRLRLPSRDRHMERLIAVDRSGRRTYSNSTNPCSVNCSRRAESNVHGSEVAATARLRECGDVSRRKHACRRVHRRPP
jgi:hypothetical protein